MAARALAVTSAPAAAGRGLSRCRLTSGKRSDARTVTAPLRPTLRASASRSRGWELPTLRRVAACLCRRCLRLMAAGGRCTMAGDCRPTSRVCAVGWACIQTCSVRYSVVSGVRGGGLAWRYMADLRVDEVASFSPRLARPFQQKAPAWAGVTVNFTRLIVWMTAVYRSAVTLASHEKAPLGEGWFSARIDWSTRGAA